MHSLKENEGRNDLISFVNITFFGPVSYRNETIRITIDISLFIVVCLTFEIYMRATVPITAPVNSLVLMCCVKYQHVSNNCPISKCRYHCRIKGGVFQHPGPQFLGACSWWEWKFFQ